MLATLRTYRFVAVLTAGTLLLSGSAPLVAHLCAWLGCEAMPVATAAAHPCADEGPATDAMPHHEGMPAHEGGVAEASVPTPHATAPCCVYERADAATEGMTLAERTAAPTLSPAPALAGLALAPPGRPAASPPPGSAISAGPPLPLHLLNGSFLS